MIYLPFINLNTFTPAPITVVAKYTTATIKINILTGLFNSKSPVPIDPVLICPTLLPIVSSLSIIEDIYSGWVDA